MASTPNNPSALLEEIRALDRSTASLLDQLSQASKIVGIQLDQVRIFYDPAEFQQNPPNASPIDERVLTWLLKKFANSDAHVNSESPFLEPGSWLLLRDLVARVPLRIAARELRFHKILRIVEKALQWLQLQVEHMPLGSVSESSNYLLPNDSLMEANISLGMISMSSSDEWRNSKKRKRDSPQSMETVPVQFSKLDLFILYACICSTLKLLEHLAGFSRNPSVAGMDPAVEQMKAVLKNSPEQAAVSLGSALAVLGQVNHILGETKQDGVVNVFDSLTKPIVMLWEHRSVLQDDLTNKASIKMFSKYCLIPVLCLILTCREQVASAFFADTKACLEKMLENYMIRPIRASYIGNNGSEEFRKRNVSLYIEELLGSLSSATSSEPSAWRMKSQSSRALSSTPILFDVCVACSLQNTPKQRTIELPWLETFFEQLSRCLSLFEYIAPNLELRRIRLGILKQLLAVVSIHKIQLKSSTIEQIVTNVSGVLDKSSNALVDWELLGVCLEINADVFIVPLSDHEGYDSNSLGRPNTVLSSLATKITHLQWHISDEAQEQRTTIFSKIMLPLMQAFVHARDLPRFIEFWKRNLIFLYEQRLDSDDISLYKFSSYIFWEDDLISQEISPAIETSLNFTQVETILQTEKEGISSPKLGSQPTPVLMASIVIIDCILNGCQDEKIIRRLRGAALEIYDKAIDVLVSYGQDFTFRNFRLWRILERIMHQWPCLGLTTSVLSDKILEKAASNALEGLVNFDRASLCDVHISVSGQNAFQVLITSVLQNGATSSNREFSVKEISRIISSISASLEISRKEMQRTGSDGWALEAKLRLEPGNDLATISNGLWPPKDVPMDKAVLSGYVERIMDSSQVLCLLDMDLLRKLFEELYWCCFWEETRDSKTSYTELWNWLRDLDLAKENSSISRCLLSVQSQNLLLSEQSTDLDRETFLKHHAFAIRQLLSSPLHTLERGRREEVASKILNQLLQEKADLDASLIVKEVNLLAYITSCNSKATILTTDPTSIWSLAESLDQISPDKSVISSFRRLVDIVLRRMETTVEHGHSKDFRTELYSILSNKVANATTLYHSPASSVLISMLAFIGRDGSSDTDPICSKIAQVLNDDLSKIVSDLDSLLYTSDIKLWATLSSAAIVPVVRKLDEPARNACSTLIDVIKRYLNQQDSLQAKISTADSLEDVQTGAKMISILAKRSEPKFHEKLAYEIELLSYLRDKKVKRKYFRFLSKMVIQLPSQEQLDLISIWKLGSKASEHDSYYLRLLRRILNVRHVSNDEIPEAKRKLSQLFFMLCHKLPQCIDLKGCLSTMQCLNTMMRAKPWAINQLHIENMLSTIATMTPPLPFQMLGKCEGEIFMGLCKLLGSMLAVHRAKMSDRYQQVIQALSGLLRCLFEPYSKEARGVDSLKLPPWLTNRDGIHMTPAHADVYTRLINSICDPTVSAVARSKGRGGQGLNDETRRARNIAGQHMPYLILEFCRYQLQGRMRPEVRNAMNPGIYAMFDVMNPDRRRMVHSGLDEAGREVFKVLHDDYRRFGRWEGE